MNDRVVMIRGGERQLMPASPGQKTIQSSTFDPRGGPDDATVETHLCRIYETREVVEVRKTERVPAGIKTITHLVALGPDVPDELKRLVEAQANTLEELSGHNGDLHAQLNDFREELKRYRTAALWKRLLWAIGLYRIETKGDW